MVQLLRCRMDARDPYQVLGVDRSASDAEIKRAFRRLARQHHPDRNPGDPAAEERFKSIQSAYDSIGSPQKRREHDQAEQFARFTGGGPGPSGLDDLLREMMRGGGTRDVPREPPKRGIDIELGIDVTSSLAESGGKVPFELSRLRRCKRCDGNTFRTGSSCPVCNGRGVHRRESTVTVTIPKIVAHGHRLRLRGLGNEHPTGAPGDLILVVRIDPGENRRWESERLIQTLHVPYTAMLLGGNVEFNTPSGRTIRMQIDAGSQPGDRRRIPGEGWQGGPLDLELAIEDVGELTPEMIEALERLRSLGL